ncbi:histone acetyltransferase NGF-1 [Ephemerocybe angulata]|uniref:Histone acetyltransferase NGF-1 n=1 Tax=Ephemerocybe angulata TaxID=980116 RepID=A0A8H6MFB7_9AGAR|nr:histone acetyltransferase NGF-1 [Tulosesus angulatus]
MVKVAYPVANDRNQLSSSLLSLKIARHAPCTQCACTGLHPSPGTTVVSDDADVYDEENYDDDDDSSAQSYLELCECGHDVRTHNANEAQLGRTEWLRRGNVGIRIDEILQDSGRLFDFRYTDEDVKSLRKQMIIPGTKSASSTSSAQHAHSSPDHHSIPRTLSDSPTSSTSSLSDIESHQPPAKRRRASGSVSSSLSDADGRVHTVESSSSSSDEEGDKPLASRLAASSSTGNGRSVPGKRTSKAPGHAGKKAKKSHHTSTAGTAPAHFGPGESAINGKLVNGNVKVKTEDKMDEGQLSRLAAGVAVDSTPARTEKISNVELRMGVIQIVPPKVAAHNVPTPPYDARALIILTGLKTLFQKQLPKMPREYIARLVYDENSRSLAIIKRGYKVVGGICFRPFPQRGFAEIVFFATNSADQEKGYGGMLMDHFKAHIRRTYPNMHHFLTYADNFAVGYFEKQGFSKEITLKKSVWAGYIKDYEGGTIMQCTMVPKVDYLDKKKLFAAQQEAVLAKVREMSRSHVVHQGLDVFKDGHWEEGMTVDPKDVPGLRETGWNPEMEKDLNLKSPDYNLMERTLHSLKEHSLSWPFREPVNLEEVPDYLDVIKTPMGASMVIYLSPYSNVLTPTKTS